MRQLNKTEIDNVSGGDLPANSGTPTTTNTGIRCGYDPLYGIDLNNLPDFSAYPGTGLIPNPLWRPVFVIPVPR